jgi:hypothetical protein
MFVFPSNRVAAFADKEKPLASSWIRCGVCMDNSLSGARKESFMVSCPSTAAHYDVVEVEVFPNSDRCVSVGAPLKQFNRNGKNSKKSLLHFQADNGNDRATGGVSVHIQRT